MIKLDIATQYDYLVVGSGLFGTVFAQQAKAKGKKVLVIDKRNNISGNVYTEKIEALKITNPVYIHLPETPLSVDFYYYDSYNGYRHQTTFKITDISCSINSYNFVDIKVFGEKTYGGSLSYSDGCSFAYKLYDMDGYLVYSSFCSTGKMEPGEKIRDVNIMHKKIEPGEYKLEIIDYVYGR
mgnify:CR=1 FL=1